MSRLPLAALAAVTASLLTACDGGGPGQYRGGTGVDYVVDVLSPAEYSFRAEGVHVSRAYGTNGGSAGVPGTFLVSPRGAEPFMPPDYGLRQLGPARVAVSSSGGGGWGDPLERDPARVLADLRDGVVSERAATEIYGLAITGGEVDTLATRERRATLRAARAAG